MPRGIYQILGIREMRLWVGVTFNSLSILFNVLFRVRRRCQIDSSALDRGRRKGSKCR